MAYKLDSQYIGYPPIEALIAAPAALNLLPITPGFLARCEDKVWGPGEVVFARANGSIRAFALCVLTPVWDATNLTYTYNATEVPNTANLGREVCVNQGGAMTAGQYGWFLVTGLTPVDCTASVAADTAFGLVAAGQGGAIAAGKQIVGARVMTPATQTVAKAGCTGKSGEFVLNVPNTDGWFVGAFISGTNIGAAARVASLDPMGKYAILTVAHTADVAATVTQTNNNATIFYNIARFNRSFAQGQIA